MISAKKASELTQTNLIQVLERDEKQWIERVEKAILQATVQGSYSTTLVFVLKEKSSSITVGETVPTITRNTLYKLEKILQDLEYSYNYTSTGITISWN